MKETMQAETETVAGSYILITRQRAGWGRGRKREKEPRPGIGFEILK